MHLLLAAICYFTSATLALRVQVLDDHWQTTTTTSSSVPTSSPSPEPTGARPLCFEPFDGHHVSNIIGMCTGLLESYVESFGDKMNTNLRWTGNNSERTRPGTVHLPQVVLKHNRTAACEIEVVDRGIGDIFEPSSLMGNGLKILDECFLQDECGEVALPPRYTTALVICGTIQNNRTHGRRPRRLRTIQGLGLWEETTTWEAGSK